MKNINKNEAKNHDVVVTRAKQFDNGDVVFDMTVNDVTIYNCRWIEGAKDGKEFKFVAFPNRKAKDNNYYNHCYVKLSQEDTDTIEKMIVKVLEG